MISWFCSPWWILPWECRILLRLLTSQLLSIICTALFTADVKYGMGKHAAYLTPHELMQAVKINFIANPFGVMAYSLPNISVAIFLNRILAPNRARKITLYTITVAQSVIAAISLIILFAQCHPTEFLWNPTIRATCLPPSVLTGYSYFVGGISRIHDCLWDKGACWTIRSIFGFYGPAFSNSSGCCVLEASTEVENENRSLHTHGHDCIVCFIPNCRSASSLETALPSVQLSKQQSCISWLIWKISLVSAQLKLPVQLTQ